MNALDLVYLGVAIATAPRWSRKARGGWKERFGRIEPVAERTGDAGAAGPRPRILLHAVSVGEVNALRSLVPLLEPHAQVIVSSTTDTGLKRAGELFQGVCDVRRFPLDVLKIDRSFVSDLDTSEDAQAICGAILSIAHRLSLDAVAEGIESEQQLAFLTKQGCQFGQGYYFSRPIEPEAIAALMIDRGAQTARYRRVEQQPLAATAG